MAYSAYSFDNKIANGMEHKESYVNSTSDRINLLAIYVKFYEADWYSFFN